MVDAARTQGWVTFKLTRTARVGSVTGEKLEAIQGEHERRRGKGIIDEHDRNIGAN